MSLWVAGKGRKLNIAFFGDVYRSRVARSTLRLLQILGHKVVVTDDGSFETRLFAQAFGISSVARSQLKKMDAVICLRFQKERGTLANMDPLGIQDLGSKTFLLHPGPVIVGEDLTYDLLEERKQRNLILSQAENAFKIRRALLAELLERGDSKK